MRRALTISVLIAAGLAVFFFLSLPRKTVSGQNQYISGAVPEMSAAQAYLLPVVNPGYAPIRETTVSDPQVDASAALVYHVDTGRYLYEKNADTRLPIASLTKLLSALVAQDLLDGQAIVAIASGSIRVDGQMQTLFDGERIMVRDLISMMLVESSNDAAYALAAFARELGIDFVERMNAKAATLGMDSCAFTDPAGLDDNAYCTARDLVRLVRFAMRQVPQIWPVTTVRELDVRSSDGRIVHHLKSTNELLDQIPEIVGGKTGYTDGALGCLILVVKVFGKSDTLISIVLGSRARFSDTLTLIDWAGRAYQWQ